jgi:hypothetical protein
MYSFVSWNLIIENVIEFKKQNNVKMLVGWTQIILD